MPVAQFDFPCAFPGPAPFAIGPAPLDKRLLLPLAGLGFGQVGKIGRKVERERDGRLDHRVVGHDDVEPQTAAAEGVDLNLDAFLDDLSAGAAVVVGHRARGATGWRRGEVVGGDEMVIHDVRRDETRGGAVNLDPKARQEPCLVKVEPLHPAADAPARVGHQDRVSAMSDQVGRPYCASVHVPERRCRPFPLGEGPGGFRPLPAHELIGLFTCCKQCFKCSPHAWRSMLYRRDTGRRGSNVWTPRSTRPKFSGHTEALYTRHVTAIADVATPALRRTRGAGKELHSSHYFVALSAACLKSTCGCHRTHGPRYNHLGRSQAARNHGRTRWPGST